MICPRCASVLLGEKHADWCVRRGPSTSELPACPNGPDPETGEWPCDRGADDSCTVCGWQPADALDKARELANWCRDGQPSRSQVRELAEFVLAALTPPSEPAVDWRAEAEFLMQMPLRYAIESYDDPPVRDRLLAQYQKVAYALVAQGGAAFGGDGAEA